MNRIKSLMDLVVTISTAIPTLVNVGSVLFLAYFIFAVLGMHLFGTVKRGEFLNEHANFETFARSLLTTFRMSTGESWNGIMHDCQVAPPHCTLGENGASGDCGNPIIAPIYFVLFQLIGQYIMLNLFIAVMLEYYQRQQDSVDPYVTEEQKDQFDDHWERFVGRDPVHNEIYPLMPARLFDDFMTFLPAHIGWSLQERRHPKLKRKALQQGASLARGTLWQSAQDRLVWLTLKFFVLGYLCCFAAPLRELPLRSMHTLIPWRLGMPRNAPDRWDRLHEKQLQEEQRAAAAGIPTKRVKQAALGVSWTARMSQSIVGAAGAFVPTAAKQGPFGAHNSDGEDELDAAHKEKARALKEQQTTTSTIEQHYYHMHEVWHCLYNRTETSHLRDPDNDEFKNEDARKRQISLFESLMQSSMVELYQAVNADIDNECCARLQVRTSVSRTTPSCTLVSCSLRDYLDRPHAVVCRSRCTRHPSEASTWCMTTQPGSFRGRRARTFTLRLSKTRSGAELAVQKECTLKHKSR